MFMDHNGNYWIFFSNLLSNKVSQSVIKVTVYLQISNFLQIWIFEPLYSYLFSSSPFCQTSFKKNWTMLKLSLCLEHIMKHKGFWRFTPKFHHEINGSKLSKRWSAQLSENPVEDICGRSLFMKQNVFLSAVFLNTFFCLKQTLQRVTTQRAFVQLTSNLESS